MILFFEVTMVVTSSLLHDGYEVLVFLDGFRKMHELKWCSRADSVYC